MTQATRTNQDIQTRVVAAIDIGSNSLRLVIAQVEPERAVTLLEQFQRTVRLGQDTFRRGRISNPTMRAAVSVLRDFRRAVDLYNVSELRAVATSSVREASNSDAFLDRVYMAAGFDVEVITTSEESRLRVAAVQEALGTTALASIPHALVAEVGGGGTTLTFLENGQITESHSLRLGSIRLQEMLSTAGERPDTVRHMLWQQISNDLAGIQAMTGLRKVAKVIAVGADARFAGRRVGRRGREGHTVGVTRKALTTLLDECIGRPPAELAQKYGLAFADAETLGPALLVYQQLLTATKAKMLTVSPVSMRDGLLLEMAQRQSGPEDDTLLRGILHSAEALAEKYHADPHHSHEVARLAVSLFDQLSNEHGLGLRQRVLLEAAALVHDVGEFVSSRAHHKHSYYLIVNSELFGLNREELQVVALVARYHRRSAPKPSHAEYTMLPRDLRMTVSKLAALLRVADALDGAHAGRIEQVICQRQEDEMILKVRGGADLILERRQLVIKGDLFEDIFGLNLRLEEDAAATPARRAEHME